MALPKKAVQATVTTAAVPADARHQVNLVRVPEYAVFERYIGRSFEGVTEFDVFTHARDTATNVLIEGPTGPGKTMAVRAYAARDGLNYYSIPSNVGIDPSQLFGKYIPDGTDADGKQVYRWQDGGLTTIARNGGVLLVNEINFMPERVASALFGLLDDRRELTLLDHKGETIRAHRPGCWCSLPAVECRTRWVLIIADMNPGYSGTRPLNAALRNRFAIQLDWDYSEDVEDRLVRIKTLTRNIVPGIRSDVRSGVLLTPVSTNMLVEFERLATTFGYDFAVFNFVTHFAEHERNAIRLAFQAYEQNIRTEITQLDDTEPDDPNWRVFANDGAWIYERDDHQVVAS
jgi:hypothetical protein